MPTEWNVLQRLVAWFLCSAFGILPVWIIIYSGIVARADNAARRRNSQYVYKGADKDGTPIYFEKPRE